MKKSFKNAFRAFIADSRGNLVPLAAFVIPAATLTSLALLEYGNSLSTKSKMQSSLDSALIAAVADASKLPASITVDERLNKIKDQFKGFYSANFSSEGDEDQGFELSDEDMAFKYDEKSGVMEIEVTYTPGKEGFIFSADTELKVSGQAIRQFTSENYVIDIVMCIDATGSMQTTIDAVKAQASNFGTNLKSELNASSENLKIRVQPIFYRDWTDERDGPSGTVEIPDFPGIPIVPITPIIPGPSGFPDTTGVPGISGFPDTTGIPSLSGIPDITDVPGLSGLPDTIDIPGFSRFPDLSKPILPKRPFYPSNPLFLSNPHPVLINLDL